MVGWLQPLVGFLYLDWPRSIEFGWFWPILYQYWAMEHKVASPSCRRMEGDAYFNFVAGTGSGWVVKGANSVLGVEVYTICFVAATT